MIPALLALLRRLSALSTSCTCSRPTKTTSRAPGRSKARSVHNLGLPRTAWRAAERDRARASRAAVRRHPVVLGRAPRRARRRRRCTPSRAERRARRGRRARSARRHRYGGCRTWCDRFRERAVLRAATVVTCASQTDRGFDRRAGRARATSAARRGSRTLAGSCAGAASRRRARAARARRELERGQGPADIAARAAAPRGRRPQLRSRRRRRRHARRPNPGAGRGARARGRDSLSRFPHPARVAAARRSRAPCGDQLSTRGGAVGLARGRRSRRADRRHGGGTSREWSPDAVLAVPCREPDALAAAIASLLDEEDLRLSIAAAAQRNAVLEDAEHTARGFDAIYRRVTAARHDGAQRGARATQRMTRPIAKEQSPAHPHRRQIVAERSRRAARVRAEQRELLGGQGGAAIGPPSIAPTSRASNEEFARTAWPPAVGTSSVGIGRNLEKTPHAFDFRRGLRNQVLVTHDEVAIGKPACDSRLRGATIRRSRARARPHRRLRYRPSGRSARATRTSRADRGRVG